MFFDVASERKEQKEKARQESTGTVGKIKVDGSKGVGINETVCGRQSVRYDKGEVSTKVNNGRGLKKNETYSEIILVQPVTQGFLEAFDDSLMILHRHLLNRG